MITTALPRQILRTLTVEAPRNLAHYRRLPAEVRHCARQAPWTTVGIAALYTSWAVLGVATLVVGPPSVQVVAVVLLWALASMAGDMIRLAGDVRRLKAQILETQAEIARLQAEIAVIEAETIVAEALLGEGL